MMRQLLIKIHRRLLSGAENLGYTPYLWLFYPWEYRRVNFTIRNSSRNESNGSR